MPGVLNKIALLCTELQQRAARYGYVCVRIALRLLAVVHFCGSVAIRSYTMTGMKTFEARRLQLETLWRTNRGDFLAEYRRVVGAPPGSGGRPMSMASMIDRIIEREASEGRPGK
jgi:hypothetical protein